jgi:hypothetical protein
MPRIRWFVIWGPWWTASMRSRVPARKPRAAPEPSFALGAPFAIDDRTKMSIKQGPRLADAPLRGGMSQFTQGLGPSETADTSPDAGVV